MTAAERTVSLEEALALAVTQLREGRFKAAQLILEAILQQAPQQPDALHYLGLLEHGRGNSEAAIKLISRAIELMPDEPGPRNNLGNIFFKLARYEEALSAYESCVQRATDPGQLAEAHNNLGSPSRTGNSTSRTDGGEPVAGWAAVARRD